MTLCYTDNMIWYSVKSYFSFLGHKQVFGKTEYKTEALTKFIMIFFKWGRFLSLLIIFYERETFIHCQQTELSTHTKWSRLTSRWLFSNIFLPFSSVFTFFAWIPRRFSNASGWRSPCEQRESTLFSCANAKLYFFKEEQCLPGTYVTSVMITQQTSDVCLPCAGCLVFAWELWHLNK